MLNADLHSHSLFSDGTLTPTQLAKCARSGGVALWAMTDHDDVSGQAEAAMAAKALGMRYIPGVEISVTWQAHTVHIVGLGIDYENDILLNGLAKIRQGRTSRALAMARSLEEHGIQGAYHGALHFASNQSLISRTHFARFLINKGICASMHQVFSQYLTPGKPGYVPHQWATLEDAVTWICGAGGIAVLAHPGRYGYLPEEFHTFYQEFKAIGGEGIEVVTSSHTPKQCIEYANIARQYGFLASRGSDFHSPKEARIKLGKLRLLPAGTTPIWSRWA